MQLEWEIGRQALRPADRVEHGTEIFRSLSAAGRDLNQLPMLLLQLAEARREAGMSGYPALALEAASGIRRHRISNSVYVPDGLERCAALLEGCEADHAAALRHVARRWVLRALADVPEQAVHSLVMEVPVNRLLLGDDARAAAASSLRWQLRGRATRRRR